MARRRRLTTQRKALLGGVGAVVIAALVVGVVVAIPYIRDNVNRNNSLAGASNSPTGIKAPKGKKWKNTFDESFTTSAGYKSKMSTCFDWNYGSCTKTFNNGREFYDPAQVSVSKGVAKLTAQPAQKAKSGCGTQGECSYKSGLLSTSRPNAVAKEKYLYKFRYGYVEARMKLPKTQGIFSAFWMLPATTDFKYMSEIDVLETLGGANTKTMYQTYHYSKHTKEWNVNKSNRNGTCPMIDYTSGYHRFGVDWQPDHITYYIDGKACGSFTDKKNITAEPMQLILNVMVDNDWQRSVKGGLSGKSTPTDSLLVDYVRVWQAK